MAETREPTGRNHVPAVVHDIAAAREKSARKRRPRSRTEGFEPAGAFADVDQSPEAHDEKVRALRLAIANGTYTPDPNEIARRILERGL